MSSSSKDFAIERQMKGLSGSEITEFQRISTTVLLFFFFLSVAMDNLKSKCHICMQSRQDDVCEIFLLIICHSHSTGGKVKTHKKITW